MTRSCSTSTRCWRRRLARSAKIRSRTLRASVTMPLPCSRPCSAISAAAVSASPTIRACSASARSTFTWAASVADFRTRAASSPRASATRRDSSVSGGVPSNSVIRSDSEPTRACSRRISSAASRSRLRTDSGS